MYKFYEDLNMVYRLSIVTYNADVLSKAEGSYFKCNLWGSKIKSVANIGVVNS